MTKEKRILNKVGRKKGCIPWNKGLTIEDKRIKKAVQAGAKARKGKAPWNKGKKLHYEVWAKSQKGIHLSPDTEFKKGQFSLEKHPNWRGGKSFELYGKEFNKQLKLKIRKRDNYICKKCGKIERNIAFDIHHIDYDKKNNNEKNLITLCKSCHMKTNHNRKYWKEYFIQ